MLVDNTPVESYELAGEEVLVKREDLCCPEPGPGFSKIRGVVAHINNRPEKYIGVLDTLHSKAGWAVSYVCDELDKQAINFWPRYKLDPEMGLARDQQRWSFAFGADMVALKAGRSAILYHQARKYMVDRFKLGEGYLMPNALKLPETIEETACEVRRTFNTGDLPLYGTMVISVSSGTIAAGVIKGLTQLGKVGILRDYDIYLHMGYSRSIVALKDYMEACAGVKLGGNIHFIDEKYSYAQPVRLDEPVPFPCNPYYDAKAWKWLSTNIRSIHKTPVIFWNVGE